MRNLTNNRKPFQLMIAVILFIAMIASLLPFSAFAAEGEESDPDITSASGEAEGVDSETDLDEDTPTGDNEEIGDDFSDGADSGDSKTSTDSSSEETDGENDADVVPAAESGDEADETVTNTEGNAPAGNDDQDAEDQEGGDTQPGDDPLPAGNEDGDDPLPASNEEGGDALPEGELILPNPADLDALKDALSGVDLGGGASADIQGAARFTVYFAVPYTWGDDYNRIVFNVKRGNGSHPLDGWLTKDMTDTGYNYGGREIYSVQLEGDECPWDGYAKIQFQAYDNSSWKHQQVPSIPLNDKGQPWLDISFFRNKLWVEDQWLDYDPSNLRTVYYDATYSKQQVYQRDIWPNSAYDSSDTRDQYLSIPQYNTRNVYFIATGDGMAQLKGKMIYAPESGYQDTYKVSIPSGYTQIQFSSFDPSTGSSWEQFVSSYGGQTKVLDIDTAAYNAFQYDRPCFYGNTNDPVIYKGGNRDGKWGEAYSVRLTANPVSAQAGTLPTGSGIYYITATLYDYYSDYELNNYKEFSNNRKSIPVNDSVSDNKYRHWVTFRQFDQALSDAYGSNCIQLYTGHFQPEINGWEYQYKDIAGILNLNGFDSSNQHVFMSTNNSWMGYDMTTGHTYDAAQGLVNSSLDSNGNIQKSSGGVLPYFDAGFLGGGNTKHAVIGNVYNNVAFPFSKKIIDGVEYWHFDSKDTTLALRSDGSRYFLQDVGHQDWSKNTQSDGSRADNGNYGFFPFNETLGGSANASRYNFGFGVKMEIKFHIPANGKVTDANGNLKDIKLNFEGDDDLWIFIDGNLILDIGGSHSPVQGTINFATGEATVSGVKASRGTTTNPRSFTLSDGETTEHTMSIFYMERGMWESNLELSFNFMDENQLSVSKTVDASNVNTDLFPAGLFTGRSFTYEIKDLVTHYGAYTQDPPDAGFHTPQYNIRDYGSAVSGTLQPGVGARYTIGSSSGRLDENGRFTLTTGQTASFRNQFRRGSYIALKEVLTDAEANLFDTKWTMLDANGTPVTAFANGSSVTNPGTTPSMSNVSGVAVDDGRIENIFSLDISQDGDNANAYKSGQAAHQANSFVFRSYSKPDETIGETELAVAYTNTVNVGSLKIEKKQAANSADLDGTYSFTVTFTNIGGLDLNNGTAITKTITLSKGGSETITGIPVGTQYTIEETAPTDGSELLRILSGTETVDAASGTITKDTTDSYVFENIKKPTVGVSVTKEWVKDGQAMTAPNASVTVKLQRKIASDSSWTDVNGYDSINLNANNSWTASYSGLDKFDNYKAAEPNAYTYRFVEVGVSAADDSIVVGGRRFVVSYTDTSATDSFATTVTNTYSPLLYDLTISKTVSGNLANRFKAFSFTLTLTDDNNQPLAGTFTCEGALNSITTGSDGTATFTLKHGQSVTIKGIPDGSHYTVTEEDLSADGYTTTVNETAGRVASGDVTQNVTVSYNNDRTADIPTGLVMDPRIGLLLVLGAAVLAMTGIELRLRRRRRDEA